VIFAIVGSEILALAALKIKHRIPEFSPGLHARQTNKSQDHDDIHIVVVGESSAEGVPYRDWVSVGKIVTWQLRTQIPDRMFHLEVQARAGWTLEQMHQKLAEIRKAPDAIILYAGHNEFASRFGWWSEVPYYDDERPTGLFGQIVERLADSSGVQRLLDEAFQHERVAMRPPISNRRVVDVPSCTPEQAKERLEDFRRRLESIAAFCQRAKILLVLVIPPGNEAGFEPNRSILPPSTDRNSRKQFARLVTEARTLESSDPLTRSIERYRALIAHQPGFAEIHFRLARLLERIGDPEGANRYYRLARDLDGHPMRCLSNFEDVYREVSRRYSAILIDGPKILRAYSKSGQLDDQVFNDAFHPSFEGQIALAQAILVGLKSSHAFGWCDTAPPPKIDLVECARHFDITRVAWKAAADFAAGFYEITMPIRFDSAERDMKRQQYAKVVRALDSGCDAETLSCPGIGVKPVPDLLKP
jgi:lysophospholipase L1-like esterase